MTVDAREWQVERWRSGSCREIVHQSYPNGYTSWLFPSVGTQGTKIEAATGDQRSALGEPLHSRDLHRLQSEMPDRRVEMKRIPPFEGAELKKINPTSTTVSLVQCQPSVPDILDPLSSSPGLECSRAVHWQREDGNPVELRIR